MKRTFIRGAWIAALAAAVCNATACQDAQPVSDPREEQELGADATKQLDAAVLRIMQEMEIPGALVGLWLSPRSAYVRAFGVADQATGAPMRADLYMRIGSVTKTVTITALLQLVDQGKLALDESISKYVPGVPAGDGITLRHLAGMQSGIYDFYADEDFTRTLVNEPHHVFTTEELLGYGFRHPLSFEPGKGFAYSNTNTVLLGLVIEKVSRQPLEAYLQEHVFAPLHLNDTSYPTTSFFPSPHPRAYTDQTPDGRAVDGSEWNLWSAGAAGAVISKLDDMRIWAKAMATGALLTPGTQAQRLRGTALPQRPDVSYGLGLFDAGGWIGHNGSIAGFESLVVYLPSQDVPLVILINTDIRRNGAACTSQLAKAMTKIATPKNPIPL